MRNKLYSGNAEPSVEELLDDPIAALLRARDGLHLDEVRHVVERVKRRLAERNARKESQESEAA